MGSSYREASGWMHVGSRRPEGYDRQYGCQDTYRKAGPGRRSSGNAAGDRGRPGRRRAMAVGRSDDRLDDGIRTGTCDALRFESAGGTRAEAVTSMQRELVERARSGDADAFTQLVRASAPRLAGVADLILRDRDRAQDAVQEACIAAWKDMRALRDLGQRPRRRRPRQRTTGHVTGRCDDARD